MLGISAIICTKDRPKDLARCIESLSLQTYPLKELIIIDSGKNESGENRDENQKFDIYRNDKILNIKYIRHVSSLTAARNMGIMQSNSDIILFLDDDVILDKNYLKNMVYIFENLDKDVGCVCGDIVSDLTRSGGLPVLIKYRPIKKLRNFIFGTLFLHSWGDGNFHPSGFPTHPIGEKDMMFIECLQGANMAFRKEILEEFRFDENLQGYCYMEDCDISYRVSRKYNIVYTPDAKLIHNVSPTSRYSDFSKMRMAVQNHYYVFKKNFPQKFYNRFAFWTSIFGMFFICLLGRRKEGIKGLCEGLRIIFDKST